MGSLIGRKSFLGKLIEVNPMGGMVGEEFIENSIKHEPTTYDVDKVIEQLEGIKQSIIPLTGMDNYYVGQLILINEIISIVKRGGKG